MPLKVLIIGAGICGPAMATLLRRSDPETSITIIERYPELRKNGQQIDLRSWGVPIIQRMGLLDAIRERTAVESGVAFVNSQGKICGLFGVDKTGTGQQGFTSEFEIMRGDLSQVLYEASLREPKAPESGDGKTHNGRAQNGSGGDGPGVRYRFGTWATAMAQDEDGVDVTLSSGGVERYDLVIGADGQGSRTRRMLFGEEAGQAMFHPLGLYVAYFTVPREAGDDDIGRLYQPGGGRSVMSRTGKGVRTQAYLMIRTRDEAVRRGIEGQPPETQKATFARLFRGAGWQTERFLAGMPGATDFYAHPVGQVRAPAVALGRVALLGDAACCAAPVTGMGTTVSLITAWTLAGELARQRAAGSGGGADVPLALRAYDASVRPYVVEAQRLIPGVPRLLTLKSRWAIALFNFVVGIVAFCGLHKLFGRFEAEDKGGLRIPEYPELKLAPVE
ncbi:FAD/NAD(P)-binding domain-containing protein [Durotheca rogersii]|uniref:FAD/NAD(P)-binding domain-containing protein n=1 Tax=Durotheca rogersii TaxID=419775 RepID=UPI00221EF965|nr:FAD/NAD(P)-binding domain-containing protein [Durotheca rogersii]KAI5865804.1 FAD/NAD(P)-binding domain-containing protein [Durotheca rogersii]